MADTATELSLCCSESNSEYVVFHVLDLGSTLKA